MSTSQQHFATTPFGPLTSRPLTPGADGEDCLFYYDEPLVFLARDTSGSPWLVQSIVDDADAEVTTDLAIPVTRSQEDALRAADFEGLIPVLDDIYRKGDTGWLVTRAWKDGTENARPASVDAIRSCAPNPAPRGEQ